MRKKNTSKSQLWKFTNDGYIQSVYNKELVFDISGSNIMPGAHIILWNKQNTDNQKWIHSNQNIISVLNTLVLDIEKEDENEEAKICTWINQGKNNQNWNIVYNNIEKDKDDKTNKDEENTIVNIDDKINKDDKN
jgi:hypothetical protein